jgi:putative transposase
MKKIKYTEEQIVGILKEVEAGITVSEICRKYGISDATYYNWKAKYGGMAASDIKRLRQLEDENRRLKHLAADLTLDNQALKAVISKNF